MKNIICWIVSRGWKFEYSSEDTEYYFLQNPRKICISAHSMPYIDGLIVYSALKYLGEINPILYGRGLFFGYGPHWYKEISTNGGFVNKEIIELSNKSSFCSVIFPSGGTIEWKSGFYILSKKLNVPIILIGIDYFEKKVIIDSIILPINNLEETKKVCIECLRKYSPNRFSLFLRIFMNYGCEVYDFNWKQIWFYRFLFISIFISFFIFYYFL